MLFAFFSLMFLAPSAPSEIFLLHWKLPSWHLVTFPTLIVILSFLVISFSFSLVLSLMTMNRVTLSRLVASLIFLWFVLTLPLRFVLSLVFWCLQQLLHYSRILLFFSNRYIYSSPSYTGLFYYRRPSFYARLQRMPYPSFLSKKEKAYSSRRYYLIFSWFFFSFFLRSFCLFLVLSIQYIFRRAQLIVLSLGAGPVSFVLLLSYKLNYNFRYLFLQSFSRWLSLKLYHFYLSLRRFFYYLNVNDYLYPFASVFQEQNPGALHVERKAIFDSHSGAWLYHSALPLSIPAFRPNILIFFAKCFPLFCRLVRSSVPRFFWHWLWLLLSLLKDTLFLLIWWLFFTIWDSFLKIMSHFPYRAPRKASMLSTLECFRAIFASRLRAILFTLPFLPFSVTLSLFLAFILRAFKLTLFFPFLFYSFLWTLLQVIVYFPVLLIRISFFFVSFFWRNFPSIFLLLFLFLFGANIIAFLGDALVAFTLLASTLPPSGPTISQWCLAKSLTYEYFIELMYYSNSKAIFAHICPPRLWKILQGSSERWAKRWHVYNWGHEWTYDPTEFIPMWYTFFKSYWTWKSHFPWYFYKRLLCRLKDPTFFCYSAHRGTFISALYNLNLGGRRNLSWGLGHNYWVIHDLMQLTTRFVEYPYFYFCYAKVRVIFFLHTYFGGVLGLPPVVATLDFYKDYYNNVLAFYFFKALNFLWNLRPRNVLETFYYYGDIAWQALLPLLLDLQQWGFEWLMQLHFYLQRRIISGEHFLLYWDLLLLLWMRQIVPSKQHLGVFCDGYSIAALMASISSISCYFFMILFSPFNEKEAVSFYSLDKRYLLSLYCYLILTIEKVWDSFTVYWQLSHMPWGTSWEQFKERYYIKKPRRKSQWLRGKHLYLRSNFQNSYEVWSYLRQFWSDARFGRAPGAEIHRNTSPWFVTLQLAGYFEFLVAFQRCTNTGRLTSPCFEPYPSHVGYFALEPTEASILRLLAILRSWEMPSFWALLIYYGLLALLLLLIVPFRHLLVFPRIFEGSSSKHWHLFKRDKSLDWYPLLTLPEHHLKDIKFPFWFQSPASFQHLLIEPKDLEDEEDYEVLCDSLNSINDLSLKFLHYRKADLESALSAMWQPFLSMPLSSDSLSLRRRWESLLCKAEYFGFKPRYQSYQEYVSVERYSHYYFDLKNLPSAGDLHRSYMQQPTKIFFFLRSSLDSSDYNLLATVNCGNFEEKEEIRAEHLYSADYVETHLKSLSALTKFWYYLDARLFDQRLGSFFLHKDGVNFKWERQEISHLLKEPTMKFKLTPLFFSKFLRNQSYFFKFEEDPAIYPFFFFWFLVFPLCVFYHGICYYYGWKMGWSPRKNRMEYSEYWVLWCNFALHFMVLSDFFYYVWGPMSTYEHIARAGSIDTVDDPAQWYGSSQDQGYYMWPWMRHLRYAEGSFIFKQYSWPVKFFLMDNLWELRLSVALYLSLEMSFLGFLLYRYRRSVPRFLLLSKALALGLSSRPVMFVQHLFYKQSKFSLKKGLLWLWLKY